MGDIGGALEALMWIAIASFTLNVILLGYIIYQWVF